MLLPDVQTSPSIDSTAPNVAKLALYESLSGGGRTSTRPVGRTPPQEGGVVPCDQGRLGRQRTSCDYLPLGRRGRRLEAGATVGGSAERSGCDMPINRRCGPPARRAHCATAVQVRNFASSGASPPGRERCGVVAGEVSEAPRRSAEQLFDVVGRAVAPSGGEGLAVFDEHSGEPVRDSGVEH